MGGKRIEWVEGVKTVLDVRLRCLGVTQVKMPVSHEICGSGAKA